MSAVLPARRSTDRTPRSLLVGKRCLDIAVGSVLLLIAIPLIAAFAIGIALTLRATPFFRHERPGLDGRPFPVIKLRTLPSSTPRYADKHAIDIEHMPLPLLCRVLRKTHLDELPQLWLVVTGRMSLVGPRPAQHPDVDHFEATFTELRTSVRPGCTGLWQVSEASGGSLGESPEFDLFYLRHASVRLDAWIVARTALWMLKLAKPLELANIPQWLLGPGFIPQTADNFALLRQQRRRSRTLAGTSVPTQHTSEEAALAD